MGENKEEMISKHEYPEGKDKPSWYQRYSIYIAGLNLVVGILAGVGSYWANWRIHKLQEYEYSSHLEIRKETTSYIAPSSKGQQREEKKNHSELPNVCRSFSYNAELHNAGVRPIQILGIFLCRWTKEDSEGCHRFVQLSDSFYLQPKDDNIINFDSNDSHVADVISALSDFTLFLQIDYANPSGGVDTLRRHIIQCENNIPRHVFVVRFPKGHPLDR